METISLDVPERILAAEDAGEGTPAAVTFVFAFPLAWLRSSCSSGTGLGMCVRNTIAPVASPAMSPGSSSNCVLLVEQKPDLTLKELRAAAGLNCALPAIHYVLIRLGLT